MSSREFRHDQEAIIAEQVRTDRLHQLFRQSMPAVFGSYLAACMLCWLCWERFQHPVVFGWMLLLTASTVIRVALFILYFRAPEGQRTPRRWELKYWKSLIGSAAIWGGGALVAMPPGDLLAQTIVVLFTVGMSVSAVSSYSAYRNMTLVSVGLVLLPSSLWLLFQPLAMQMGIGLATLVFASFVVRFTRKHSDALEAAFRLTREMERAHSISTYAAQTDELTGLKNRRAFFEQAQQLFKYAERNRISLCVVMLDMDHFKLINDTYGHQVGDEVLRQMGRVISAIFREADICGRLGGEEFAMLLPDTTIKVALGMAEQLIKATSALRSGPVESMTASLGIACSVGNSGDLHNLINAADKALYRAKALGRNQVLVAE